MIAISYNDAVLDFRKPTPSITRSFSETPIQNPLDLLRSVIDPFKALRQVNPDISVDEIKALFGKYFSNSGWNSPCEDMFLQLVSSETTVFLNILKNDVLEPGLLSIAAEVANRLTDQVQVIDTLIPLTYHKYPIVREGAIYGLFKFAHLTSVVNRLHEMADTDESLGVRAAAQELLEG